MPTFDHSLTCICIGRVSCHYNDSSSSSSFSSASCSTCGANCVLAYGFISDEDGSPFARIFVAEAMHSMQSRVHPSLYLYFRVQHAHKTHQTYIHMETQCECQQQCRAQHNCQPFLAVCGQSVEVLSIELELNRPSYTLRASCTRMV